ncbi:HAD family hydrolase [Myceligenerans salitolerans]|uniref:HAD-IB family hydrolase n=1 Tax=Myceligenerans salitolerans TaxID=1230528 RepID=A0ABS3IB76_9MICO|nr:HAD-IB family hydrolase [Myceligenerans salitolerans]MBO0609629.1 HAD-IB family hydrolase [Myceligenerans salitolerans]
MTDEAFRTVPPGFPARDTAAFFDLDKTIIATSSSQAFSKPFIAGGLISRADVLRSAYAHFLFLVGNADEDQTERMRAHLSALATGWDVRKVREIVAETVHEHIDPYVYAEAIQLIQDHHDLGHDVVIVSASGSELVEPIAAVLGADHVLATHMEVVDDHYTGEIDFYNYGENKASSIRELAARQGYDLTQCYAYSDSITDAPMLGAVGHAFVVNPDRNLRRLAAESGWGLLRFTRPVALRPRVEPIPVAAVVGAVAIGVAAYFVARHLRRRRENH